MAAHRATLRAPAQADIAAGRYTRAAKRLERAAIDYGDPVLFLDAADAWLYEARTKHTMEPLRRAERAANIAIDIAMFVEEVSHTPSETRWKVVAGGETGRLVERAEVQLEEVEALMKQIRDDVSDRVSAAEEVAGEEDDGDAGSLEPYEPKPYRPMMVAGGILLSAGLAGVGVLATGMTLGFLRQREIDDLELPGEDQTAHEITQEGDRANVVAYIGLGLGVVGLGAGIPLLAVGKSRKRATHGESARVRIAPALGGLSLSGRF
jgi:hypothetical protein